MLLVPVPNPAERTWNYLYLSITVVAIGVVAAKLTGLPPFENLRWIALVGLIVGSYAVTATAHWYDRKR